MTGDSSSFWHGFTNMRGFARRGVTFTAAEGVWVMDATGKRYLNAFSSLANLNLGAGRKRIADEISRQAHQLPYFTIERATHDAAEEYARRLVEVTPEGLDTVFYASTGAEANETIIKLMRQCQRLRHGASSQKVNIIALDRGFHGVTYGALSATGSTFGRWREQFEPLAPGFHHAPSPYAYRCALGCGGRCDLRCAEAIERMISRLGQETVAGVLIEPVLGVGGVIVPSREYHQRLREICDRHDILLAYDEVITGFGRLGTWFGADHFGVTPDFMALSKGINGGYLPFGAVVMKRDIYQTFLSQVDGFVATGGTTNGNPICCAAALATLDIMRDENVVEHAAETGRYMFDRFTDLLELPIVGEIRGAGLLMAVELVKDRATRAPIPAQAWQVIEDRIALTGLIVGAAGSEGIGGNILIAPPLSIEPSEVDDIHDRLAGVLRRYSTLLAR